MITSGLAGDTGVTGVEVGGGIPLSTPVLVLTLILGSGWNETDFGIEALMEGLAISGLVFAE